MSTILLAVETETSVDDLPGIEATGNSTDDLNEVELGEVSQLVEAVDAADIEVAVGAGHSEWEQGQPCPDCGSSRLSVLEPEEWIYDSQDGDFQYLSGGDASGGILSVLCPNCMTYLHHVPVDGLYQ